MNSVTQRNQSRRALTRGACYFLSLCFSIQEKEKLYVELKHIMAKQPGPEVAEQLYHSQKSLQEQTKKLRVLHLTSRLISCFIVLD